MTRVLHCQGAKSLSSLRSESNNFQFKESPIILESSGTYWGIPIATVTSVVWVKTYTGPTNFQEIYGRGPFVGEVNDCKDILLMKQVDLLAWPHVNCFYDHTVSNSHKPFFSGATACCLCCANTYRK